MPFTPELAAYASEMMERKAIRGAPYRSLYDGHHPSNFATGSSWTNPMREVYAKTRDNQCRNVVDAVVDALEVISFRPILNQDPLQGAVASRAFDVWQSSRASLKATAFFRSIEITGEEGMAVSWVDSQGRSRLYWIEPEFCYIERDGQSNEIVWASKKHVEGDFEVITLYGPDTVEQFAKPLSQDESILQEFRNGVLLQLPINVNVHDNKFVPVSTLDNPLGFVPAVGVNLEYSDLESVAPLQKLLNETLANLAINGAYYSQPLRVWLGIEVEKAPDGSLQPPFNLAESRNVFLPGKASADEQSTDVKDLSPQSGEHFIDVSNSLRHSIARVSRTPVGYLVQSYDYPSGEALRLTLKPYYQKMRGRHDLYGAFLSEAMALLMQIEALLLVGEVIERPLLNTIWHPIDDASEESSSRVAETLHRIGADPQRLLVQVMGWSEEQAQQALQGNSIQLEITEASDE